MDKIAYGAAKKYVDKTVDGLGAIKGAPCTIKSITETADENIIVFEWTGNSGEKETSTLTIKNGSSNGSSKILTGGTFENPIVLSNLESGLYICKDCYVTDWVSEDVDVILYVEPILVSINTDNATYIFFRDLVNYSGYYSYYEDGEIYVEYNSLLYSNSPEADTNYVPLTDSSLTTKKYVDDMSAYSLAKKGGYSGTEEEFAEKLAAEIPSKTSDLTNDSDFTTLALDDTLTDNTKAAPAGMVGELKDDLADLQETVGAEINVSKDFEWIIGQWVSGVFIDNGANGTYAHSTKNKYKVPKGTVFISNSTWVCYLGLYDSDLTYLETITISDGYVFEEDAFVTLGITKANKTTFTEADRLLAVKENRFCIPEKNLYKEVTNLKKATEDNNTEIAFVKDDISQLSEKIDDLKENGTSGTGLNSTAKNLLIAILRNGVYSEDQSANITALETALSSGGTEQPESGIEQIGSILAITSGVTATQTGSVLAIS